jgi:alpha-beta hydrolase superfamily lysophospholipase
MRFWSLSVLVLAVFDAGEPPGTKLTLRGEEQELRLYGRRGGPSAIVASGDGGWTHLAPYVSDFLARQGYYVVGLDSRHYLSSFTRGGRTLAPGDVPGDFRKLVEYAADGSPAPPLLVGVSEGAALAVLAATDDGLKSRLGGVVGLGLPDRAELGWRWKDSIIYVTKRLPDEPSFSTADVIGRVAPLPVLAIHSTRDEFVPADEVQRVMEKASAPKQLWFVSASDHRFSDNTAELDRKLLEGIAWIKEQWRPASSRPPAP